MVAAITADQLLERVKARAQIPASEGRLSDAEILALAGDALLVSVGREVYDADDGRWIHTAEDAALTAGEARYRLPSRAWGSDLDGALLVDSAGNAWPLDYVDRDDAWQWQRSTGCPAAYTIEGDSLRLLPTPGDTSVSLRVRYMRRPSRLVTVAEAALIASVASGSVTVGTVPSTWGASETLDIIRGEHHGTSIADDLAATIASTTITIAGGVPDLVAAGDYVCLAGESCVVQAPDVAIPYLADMVARDVCAALGDPEGMERCAVLAESRRRDMAQGIARRSRTAPRVINRVSPLRAAGQRRGWPWGHR